MRNKINFITGETYTLGELFSGIRRIIIPDLQRDYCWGNEEHTAEKKELVSGFVKSLVEQYDNEDNTGALNLGLIYGYEAPENHIQLCDGQQRITTLFLLLGMLNKKTSDNAFQKYLISDYEYFHDDREPYLQYSIRESSLYFLSDLVCHFFVNEKEDSCHIESVCDIKSATWFFNEYNLDPSICSMIKALEKIQDVIKGQDEKWCREFGRFITTDLTFMYYDMENRKNGEETFVVINTTGEPLSNTQNLKPLVLLEDINKTYSRAVNEGVTHTLSEDWEEIENWFWQKRVGDNDTADAGFNEFFRWVTMLYSDKKQLQQILSTGIYTFPRETISFEEIWAYWKVVRFLFDEWGHKGYLKKEYLSPSKNKDAKDNKVIGQIDCFLLLPLIQYCRKWNINDSNDRNLLRLYEFVHNLMRIDNVSKDVNNLVYDIVQIALSFRDIVELLDSELSRTISTTLLTSEEKLKLDILKENPSKREEIEELFWQAQSRNIPSHIIWSGQILPLIEWSITENGFSIDLFKKYSSLFDAVFVGNSKDDIGDIVRRALITRNLIEYPKVFRGNTNYSFAYEWSDWHVLINENIDGFKSFFDDLDNNIDFQSMIDGFPVQDDWAEFVHVPELLRFCKQKNIQWWPDGSIYLIEKTYASGAHANIHSYKYYLSRKDCLLFSKWTKLDFYPYYNTCVYLDKESKKIAIDAYWNGGKNSQQMAIEVHMRNTKAEEIENVLKPILNVTGYNWNGARYVYYFDAPNDEQQAFALMDKEIKHIVEFIDSIMQ
jgi:uncharacterized protein with ParB-like and HNH nuclease domain